MGMLAAWASDWLYDRLRPKGTHFHKRADAAMGQHAPLQIGCRTPVEEQGFLDWRSAQ